MNSIWVCTLTTDYTCEDGRIRVYSSCVAISNFDSLFRSERVVNSGMRSWKKLYRVRSMSKSHWLYVSKCPLYSSPAGGMLMLSCLAFWHAKLISRGETSIEAHINKAEAKRLATIGKVSQLNGFPKNDFKLLSLQPLFPIDYRCDDRRFWLSAPNCQVSTPTSQNLDLEQPIRIFEAD
jgi:hypothetical protein